MVTQVVESDTAKLGLLLETAQIQQETVAAGLAQLQAHTRGLDQIVRVEVRRTLLEQLAEVSAQGAQTVTVLRALERAAHGRTLVMSVVVSILGALIGALTISWYLPTPAEIERLRAERDALQAQMLQLRQAGAGISLRRCGAEQRWCVRIDRNARAYGTDGDYRLARPQ